MDRNQKAVTSREASQRVLTVSQLTALIKQALESTFPLLWVSGELSDVSRPQSGHIYFSLKDAQAQIRGVVWRSTAVTLPFEIRDGMEVACLASLDVYPPRGGYQLEVRRMEPLGLGAQQLALRQLQEKLSREGLFDPRHKKPLPRFPRRIGLITSPTAAAVRDFLEVIRRRWSGSHVQVLPTKVQGDGAEAEIVRALRLAHRITPRPDVLVLARGGGSLDDLCCFNREAVVRAVFASEIPLVSAIGHEIDVTLCDLVADVRALTPSEAAELVAPSQEEIVGALRQAEHRLTRRLKQRLAESRARLEWLAQRPALARPFEMLHMRARRVDELYLRSGRLMQRHLAAQRRLLDNFRARLDSLSPLATLQRGYSVTRTTAGDVVRSADQVVAGQRLVTRLARGEIVSRVESGGPSGKQAGGDRRGKEE
jgi:exodeoxyribonuclease VII large subunit